MAGEKKEEKERDDKGRFLVGHKKVGDYIPTNKVSGEQHPAWKGDEAGYFAKHIWVSSHYGKADHCEFDPTHIGRFEWSNKSGQYLRERSDWRQLCASCHRKLDFGNKNECRKGHPFTDENTYVYPNGQRKCRLCAAQTQRKYMARKRQNGNTGN